MAKRGLQIQLVDDTLDNPTATVADHFIELTKELKMVKEKKDIQELNLLGLLNKMKKTQVRHKGMLIKVTYTEAKEKLVVKEPKKAKEA